MTCNLKCSYACPINANNNVYAIDHVQAQDYQLKHKPAQLTSPDHLCYWRRWAHGPKPKLFLWAPFVDGKKKILGSLKVIQAPKWVLVVNDKTHVHLIVYLSMCAGGEFV